MLPSEKTAMSEAEFQNSEFANVFNQSVIIVLVWERKVWSVKSQAGYTFYWPLRTQGKAMLAQDYCLNLSQEVFLQWLLYLWKFRHCNKGQKWFLVVRHVLFTCLNSQRENSSNIAADMCPKWITAGTNTPRECLFFLGSSKCISIRRAHTKGSP